MKKVLVITPEYPPDVGGVARYSESLVKALKKNFEVYQVVPERFKPEVGWIRVPFNFPGFRSVGKLMRLIRKENISAIYIMNIYPPFTLILSFFARLHGKKVYVLVHGLDIWSARKRLVMWPMYSLSFRFANKITGNSQGTIDLMEDIYRSTRGEGYVINPIVPEIFLNLSPEKPNQVPIILTVSRLVERKRVDLPIRALANIHSDFTYLVLGDGPKRDELQELAKELNIDKKVKFLGKVSDEVLIEHYKKCDLFILTSESIPEKGDFEGFGVVYLEANSLAKPVIGTECGGIKDAILHGVSGVLIPPGDEKALQETLEDFFKNRKKWQEMGKKGLERAKRDFTSKRMEKQLLDLLGQ